MKGSRNLSEVLLQALMPIQDTVLAACSALSIEYGGIDASINPGLSLSDSVGAGLESLVGLVSPPQESKSPHLQAHIRQFGIVCASCY